MYFLPHTSDHAGILRSRHKTILPNFCPILFYISHFTIAVTFPPCTPPSLSTIFPIFNIPPHFSQRIRQM